MSSNDKKLIELSINKLKSKKNKLEQDICDLINKFQEETNCRIFTITLGDFIGIDNDVRLLSLKTTIKL